MKWFQISTWKYEGRGQCHEILNCLSTKNTYFWEIKTSKKFVRNLRKHLLQLASNSQKRNCRLTPANFFSYEDSTRWGRLWGLSTRPRDRVQNGLTTRYKSWANFLCQNQYRFCERVPTSKRQCRPMMATMRHRRTHRLRHRDLRSP